MTRIKALGGLGLEPAAFTQPKPLLLLTYLALEGAQQRRHLAELFWPEGNRMKSLSMTLTRLRQAAPEVVAADEKRAWTAAPSDAGTLLTALDEGDWQRADALYSGAFAEGVALAGWGGELEEWVFGTREYLAERVQHALLSLAEEAARAADFARAASLAERAFKLPGSSAPEPSVLRRLYTLLSAGRSRAAPEVRKELESYGLPLRLSSEAARAELRGRVSAARSPHNLAPRGTSFVGREAELAQLGALLGRPGCRLLTLLGPGGTGKTRLAQQAALAQLELGSYPDGVYLVCLEAVSEARQLPLAILEALGLSRRPGEPWAQLASAVAEKRLLLLLDNLEQLREAAPALAGLLRACPNLDLLATSRLRLGLEEEQLFPLAGLALPAEDTPRQQAQQAEAVALFAERARQLKPDFDLEAELPEVLSLCRQLEGLPLALELAAGWVRLMGCAELGAEIANDLDFLTTTTSNVPERHQSLRAVFEASWRLLSAREQEVLRRLSVFQGGFRREAAAEVAGATIPLLAALVDKSLLRVSAAGRYDRHPLLYQFTRDKLAGNPVERRLTEAKHQAYYLALAEQAEAHVYSDARGAWFRRFDEELDNLRAVLNRSRSDAVARLRLLTALPQFWQTRGHQQEARSHLAAALQACPDKLSPLYAKGLYTLAEIVWQRGDGAEARLRLEEAQRVAEAIGDSDALARTLGLLGRVYHYNLADSARARALYQESIALAEVLGNRAYQASALNLLAILVSEQGDFESAADFYHRSLALWRLVGNKSGVAYVLNNLANIHDNRGDYPGAAKLFEESLVLFRELGEKDGMAMALGNLGMNCSQRGRYGDARPLLEESLALAREVGDERLTAYLLRALGHIAFYQRDDPQAEALYRESYALYAHFGYLPGMADALRALGEVLHQRRSWERAEQAYLEGLALSRSAQDLWSVTHFLRDLALLYLDQGRCEPVRGLLSQSLDLARGMNNRKDAMQVLEAYAHLAAAEGRLELAAVLSGTVEAVRQELGLHRDGREMEEAARFLAGLRSRLGSCDAARERGRRLGLEEAIELITQSA